MSSYWWGFTVPGYWVDFRIPLCGIVERMALHVRK